MREFIINIFIYTFAIYGIWMVLKEIKNLLGAYKGMCTIILIPEENENTEALLKEIWEGVKDKRNIRNIYVSIPSEKSDFIKVTESYCKDNSIFIRAKKEELVELINEKISL